MTSPWQSFLLGIVQGLSEFLPISSSAHLILIPRFFHWPDPGLAFDVALHMGTLAGVVIYFWKDLTALANSLLRPTDPALAAERKLVGYLLIATVPGAVMGLLFEHKIETVLRSPHLIGWTLIIMGTLLALADYTSRGDKSLADLTWKLVLVLGLSQALALIPGVSRSGVTITTALFLGMQRPAAARFSFLMSVPITAGAGILKFKEILHAPDQGVVLAGLAGSALSGFFAIWFLLRYVQTRRYTPFAVYRWALGLLILFNLSHFQ